MTKWLRKHRNTIFLITIGGFLIGSFMGFGSYFFTQSPYDAAIVVNGEDISYQRYQNRFRQYVEQKRDEKTPLNQDRMKTLRQETLQDLVRETVFVQEADKYGVVVTDDELAAYIQRAPAFQRDGRFDPNAYLQVVTQIFHVSPDEFEADRRRELKIQKLQGLLASAVKIGPLEYNWSYQKKMSVATPEEKKAIAEKPAEFLEQLRQEQTSYVMQEWLGQVNGRLKVKVMLDKWEGRGEG